MSRCCARIGRSRRARRLRAVEKALKYPVFVKPANLGSSVGISKAHDREELGPALELAAKIRPQADRGAGRGRQAARGSQAARAREFEVAVLGNDEPKASVVGEIIPGKEFYDYEAKYLSEGSVPVIPAKLTRDQSRQIREMAVAAFKACDLSGLARVDFLMEPEGKRANLSERSEHHARLYADQHVSEAVGGVGAQLQRTDYAAD